MTHYSAQVDVLDDGNFSEDWGTLLLKLEWQQGMAAPYDSLTAPTVARLILRNDDKRFSGTAGAALIGQSLRITGDSVTHFTGQISAVTVTAGDHGERLALISANGHDAAWFTQEAALSIASDQRTDQLILALLRRLQWRYPAQSGRLIVNRGSIGQTLFERDPFSFVLQAGLSTVSDARPADASDGGAAAVLAADHLRQIAALEGGRLYTDRDGRVIFLNRHHLLLNDTVKAHFSDDLLAVDTGDGGAAINEVRVLMQPRHVGTLAPLWNLNAPIRVQAGARLLLHIAYQHEGAATSAHSVQPPVRGVDYRANSRAAGNGDDLTGEVTVVLAQIGASGATLEIRGSADRDLYLTHCQIYGEPLLVDDPLAIVVRADDDQVTHGARALVLAMPLLADVADGHALAEWALLRRRDAVGAPRWLHTDAQQHPAAIHDLTLFDRARVTLTQTAHEADYHIIAAQHVVDQGGARHRVAWLLEPAPDAAFVIVDRHILDDGRVLVPR